MRNHAAKLLAALALALGVFAASPTAHAGPTDGRREREEDRRPQVCQGAPSAAQARPLIVSYYARDGEWAGQYVIQEIAQMRFVRAGNGSVEAHVRYRYHCIRDRCGGSLDEGFDQRIFYFQCRADRWRVVQMGPYMSAQL